jgi:geranylgeranyl pyrophosphate synthase
VFALFANDRFKYTSMKGFCEDLDEGKFSLPLIHTFHNTAYAMELRGLLQRRRVEGSLTTEQKHMVLEHMKEAGSLEYTLRVLKTLYDAIEAEISRLESVFGKRNYELRLMVDVLKV